MSPSLFDDLLPPFHELDAFVATHVMGWSEVRWHRERRVYIGRRPGSTVDTPVPLYSEQDDLAPSVLATLEQLGHGVQTSPVPEGWRVQVDEAAATLRTLPMALCAAVWRALDG